MFLPNRLTIGASVAAAFIFLASVSAEAGDFDAYRWEGDSVSVGAGDSQAHNIAVQTIDPWAPHSKNTRINIDGSRALIGIERYKQNKSIPPRGLTTQSVNSTQTGDR